MRSRIILGIAVLAAASATLTGCSISTDMFSKQAENRFADHAEFTDDADLVFRSAEWVPKDSTKIAVAYFTSEPGNMMTFSSTTGVESDDCSAEPLTGDAPLETGWWPSDEPADGLVCGDWQVFGIDGNWYAWTN